MSSVGGHEELAVERQLRELLAAERDGLDASIAAAGVAARVRHATLASLRHPLAGMDWRRIAAAIVVAGMLGGALGLLRADPAPLGDEVVLLDPLSAQDVASLP